MRLAPRSLMGRLALLIIGAFLVAQIVSVWLFTDERGAALRSAHRLETADRTAAVVLALEDAPEPSRPGILAAVNSRQVRFSLDPEPSAGRHGTGRGREAEEDAELPALAERIKEQLDPARELRAVELASRSHRRPHGPLRFLGERIQPADAGPAELRLSVRLQDGQWLNVRSRSARGVIRVPPVMMGTMLLSLVLITGALWLGLGRITGPLRKLAAAAENFGIDGPPPAMPTGGPREVRALSEALVRMHARVSGMMADRTRMLAALGHDLRSPITALRLRAEMVDDDETRERMVATLAEMQEMVEATLAFARGVSPDQPTEPVDLTALLAGLAAELSETGAAVTMAPAEPLVLDLRRMPMRRALRNVIENAQRYAGSAAISLHRTAGTIEIRVEDDGPGIPESRLEEVLDPFARLETSRSRETGGTGLGLSIARAILRAHGGELHLTNRPEGGLRATVTLPDSRA